MFFNTLEGQFRTQETTIVSGEAGDGWRPHIKGIGNITLLRKLSDQVGAMQVQVQKAVVWYYSHKWH